MNALTDFYLSIPLSYLRMSYLRTLLVHEALSYLRMTYLRMLLEDN